AVDDEARLAVVSYRGDGGRDLEQVAGALLAHALRGERFHHDLALGRDAAEDGGRDPDCPVGLTGQSEPAPEAMSHGQRAAIAPPVVEGAVDIVEESRIH